MSAIVLGALFALVVLVMALVGYAASIGFLCLASFLDLGRISDGADKIC
jgi:hypothetical protein